MKIRITVALILLAVLPSAKESVTETLQAVDRMLHPDGASWEISLRVPQSTGDVLYYRLRYSRLNAEKQRLDWLAPAIMKGDAGLIREGVVYFKFNRWPKPELMSSQSALLDSSFNWDDILSPSFADDFSLSGYSVATNKGRILSVFDLKPLKESMYPRIVLEYDREKSLPASLVFHNSAGAVFKKAVYSDFVINSGQVSSYRIVMYNEVLAMKAEMDLRALGGITIPARDFLPASVGARPRPAIPGM